MGLVGNILSGPGKVVEGICDSLLPAELEWIGDVASFYGNFQSGNLLAAAMDLVDLYENVKNGDFNAQTMFEGLKKMLPPDSQAFLDKLIHPDPPPGLNAAAETRGSSKKPKASKPEVPRASEDGGKVESGGKTAGGKTDISRMTDDEVMAMVRSGKIPKELRDDKAAMMALQQRMNDIQEMNALLTNMIRAMHEMQMEIIRNVRA